MYFALALALLVLVTRLLTSIPTARLSEAAWRLWTVHAPSPAVRELRAHRDALNDVRAQRANTSSQDEFAKWARLDRRYQQLKKEHDVLQTSVGSDRQRFNRSVRIAKWLSTSGIRWYVQWRFRRTPVAWVPHGAVPGYIEYFLAFPSAPRGSISTATWVFAADKTIDTIIKLVRRARRNSA